MRRRTQDLGGVAAGIDRRDRVGRDPAWRGISCLLQTCAQQVRCRARSGMPSGIRTRPSARAGGRRARKKLWASAGGCSSDLRHLGGGVPASRREQAAVAGFSCESPQILKHRAYPGSAASAQHPRPLAERLERGNAWVLSGKNMEESMQSDVGNPGRGGFAARAPAPAGRSRSKPSSAKAILRARRAEHDQSQRARPHRHPLALTAPARGGGSAGQEGGAHFSVGRSMSRPDSALAREFSRSEAAGYEPGDRISPRSRPARQARSTGVTVRRFIAEFRRPAFYIEGGGESWRRCGRPFGFAAMLWGMDYE